MLARCMSENRVDDGRDVLAELVRKSTSNIDFEL